MRPDIETLEQLLRNQVAALGPRASRVQLLHRGLGAGYGVRATLIALDQMHARGAVSRDPAGLYILTPVTSRAGELTLASPDPGFGQPSLSLED